MSGAVPKLRFREFAGEWQRSPLDKIAAISSGGTPSRDIPEYWGGSIPWITTSEINGGAIRAARQFITDSGLKNSSAKIYKSDTILLAMYGQGQTRGRVAILKIESATNQACAAIIVKPQISPRFILQNLTRRYEELRDLANDGSQKNLSGALIKKLPIYLPTSLPEQQKISDFLGTVDAKLDALRRKKSGLEAFKSGLMQKLFSQEIRFTRDDGSEFPEWEDRPFTDIAQRAARQFDPRKDDERPPLIELENLESGTGRIIGHADLDSQISLKNTFNVGDVLFGKLRPYLRKFAHPDFDGVCSSEIWVLRPMSDVVSEFLYFLVQSDRFSEAANMSSGSKMPRADWKTVASTAFPFPHPDEQRKIADALTALDTKITAVQSQITEMEAFKKGLLQQMFV